VLLATVEPGQEVVICDPVYAGLVNRIRLADGVPRFVSCTPGPGGWATDPGELAAAIGPQTAAVLLMSPVMPTGAVLGSEHLDAIAGPVRRHRAWVIWDAAMERIRFDSQPPVHPAAHPGLADRTITVGSASATRAIPTSCRSPAERRTPRVCTSVLIPLGSDSNRSRAPISSSARSTS